VPSRPKGKEKALQDAQFEAERQWLILYIQAGAATAAAEKADLAQQEHQNDSDSIECGCCFSAYPFVSLSIILAVHRPSQFPSRTK
jgi:TRIAD3 protein (E3 ubiquitin-protein ligase RNF216)